MLPDPTLQSGDKRCADGAWSPGSEGCGQSGAFSRDRRRSAGQRYKARPSLPPPILGPQASHTALSQALHLSPKVSGWSLIPVSPFNSGFVDYEKSPGLNSNALNK